MIKLDPRKSLVDQAGYVSQRVKGLPFGHWKCPACGNGGRIMPRTDLSDEGLKKYARDLHSQYFPHCPNRTLEDRPEVQPVQGHKLLLPPDEEILAAIEGIEDL